MNGMLLLLSLGLLPLAASVGWEVVTPLDEYVHAEDPNYGYEILRTYNYSDIQVVVYICNMTSQKWLDETISDHSIWWHLTYVAIPYEIQHPEYGFLIIGGGYNTNPEWIPDEEDTWVQMVANGAADAGIVGGYINQVPNQPIVMTSDPDGESRSEDNWISWTWNTYIYRNPDGSIPPSVLARYPMTKAAKAGLDTMRDVSLEQAGLTVDKFIPMGASKRGWTTWSLAATDRRVVGAVPLVFTLLNMTTTMQKHFQSLGGYTYALAPYFFNNMTMLLADDEQAARLIPHEDMYSYKERYTIPIMNIVGTGDEFFQPDDSHYWLKDLPGWKKMFIIPNVGHGLGPLYPRVWESTVAFCKYIMTGTPLPDFTYEGSEDETSGYVTLNLDNSIPPSSIEVTAHAGESNNDTASGIMRRDFRVNDPLPSSVWFEPVPVEQLNSHEYRSSVEKVDEKFVGQFIQVRYPAPDDWVLWLTSEFHVSPDTFPYPPCQTNDECHGSLV